MLSMIPMSPGVKRDIERWVPRAGRRALRGFVNRLRHYGLSERDVFLASYPKSGNTWLKFLLSDVIAGHDVDFDSCELVIPHVGAHDKALSCTNGVRVIKTHERYREEYHRAIYLVRDGRDVAVSYYYQRSVADRSSFGEFLKRFLAGDVDYVGPWHENVASWLRAQDRCELELVRYEDCLREPTTALRRLSSFIGLEVSDSTIQQSIERNSLKSMREKERRPETALPHAAAPFVRKGIAGDWRNHFSERDHELFLHYAGATLTTLGYAIE